MRILDFADGFESSTQPTAGAVPASGISVTPTGNLSSTDVQSGLVELQTDIDTINAEKGVANGLASLAGDGKIPASQLPSYVDDVVEFANLAAFPATGETGKIYVALDTNKTYRWSGSTYIEVSPNAIVSVNGHIGVVVLDQTDIGLPNVDNTSDATKNAATATLQNKTLETPVVDVMSVTDQTSIPSTPASGSHKLYSKAGGMYILDSTGTEKPVGSGSGGGSKNYLSNYNGNPGNGDFELNNTNGWSRFTTTLTGVRPTGSISAGATSWTTWGIASGARLSGLYSLSAGGASGLTAGEGFISDVFTIDDSDKASLQAILFNYKLVSGTIDFSGTSTNTLALYIRDVTNGVWFEPSRVYGIDGSGKYVGSFQSTGNSTQYQLAVICINSCTGITDFLFDDFNFGPLTISESTHPFAARYSQSASVTVTAATNMTFDTIDFESEPAYSAGVITAKRTGLYHADAKIYTGTATYLNLMKNGALYSQGDHSDSSTCATISDLVYLKAGETLSVQAVLGGTTIPGGNAYTNFAVFMLSDSLLGASGRVVSWSGVASTQGVSANATDISFVTNPNADRTNSWNGNQFICPEPGDYVFFGNIGHSVAGTSPYPCINGAQLASGNAYWESSPQSNYQLPGCHMFSDCKTGDILSLRVNASGTVTNGYLCIFKLNTGASSQVPETVSCILGLTNTYTFAINSQWPMDTKLKDTHNAYDTSTGVFTAPRPGEYEFTPYGNCVTNTNLILYKNSVAQRYICTCNNAIVGIGTAKIQLVTGDQVVVSNDTSTQFQGHSGFGFLTGMDIKRVGD